MIVSAAIQINELILSMPMPARHSDIIHKFYILIDSDPSKSNCIEIQGFLTNEGNFLDRRNSMKHAISCGQGTPRRDKLKIEYPDNSFYDGEDLFSEDLW